MLKEERLDREWCRRNNVEIVYRDLSKEQAMAMSPEISPGVFQIIISDQIPADNIAPLLRHEIIHLYTNLRNSQWFYLLQGKQSWIDNMYREEIDCYQAEFKMMKKLIRSGVTLCPAMYQKYQLLKKGISQFVDKSPVFGIGYIREWNRAYDDGITNFSRNGKLIIPRDVFNKMKYSYSRPLKRLKDKYVVV